MKHETTTVEPVFSQVREIIQAARASAYRAVNSAMVTAYWHIGRLIVEEEQRGERRASYGEALILGLAQRLTQEFGEGFSEPNLKNFRQFYLTYSNSYAVRSELTWTHYRLLMRVANPRARAFYEEEAVKSGWSTRALERQIHTFYYDRLLASQDALELRADSAQSTAKMPLSPRDFIKDPYVLEFLDLKPGENIREDDLETFLVANIQRFLLELGRGFALVDRQKHMEADGEHFFVDLVFYHYLLRCFVLIDLKVGKLTHQDIGQMDFYVRLFDEKFRLPGDLPTVGLILCSEKNKAVAKYSVLQDNPQLFASKYLPSEEELKSELERERMLAELGMEQAKQVISS
jgi:predicted nuclease of restriction endonuclease-like (RecB) superfamily